MNWTLLLIGFSLAVLMGAGLAALLVQLRPQWSAKQRMLVAASFLPAVTIVCTLLALAFVWSVDNQKAEMRDLAVAAVATIGGTFTLVAFAAGSLGAMLAQRRRGE